MVWVNFFYYLCMQIANPMYRNILYFILFSMLFGCSTVNKTSLNKLCKSSQLENSQLGICVYDLTADKMLYTKNPGQLMRPASCMKLLTSVTALDLLGSSYTFIPHVDSAGQGWCWDDSETQMMPYSDSIQWTLSQILVPVLKNSDNIKAESVFYQLDIDGDTIFSQKQAVANIKNLIRKCGLDPNKYRIADGSGLSLYNYVSPELIVGVLYYAWHTPSIQKELLNSLPIAGVDGTLAKRMRGTKAQGNVHAKTGTVTGISSLSGYCTAHNGHKLAFSIINQGIFPSSKGRTFQDKFCERLCK